MTRTTYFANVTPAVVSGRRHHHGNHLQRALAMKIENERTNLTQSEQNVLAEDRERWKRMGAGTIANKVDNWPFDARPHAKKVKKAIDVACNGIIKIRDLVPPEVGAQFANSRHALQ
jgi:hypothetical protein